MDQAGIKKIIEGQRAFFRTGTTKDTGFRLEQLGVLKRAIVENMDAILAALKADLGKPALEAYGGDPGLVIKEIDYAAKRLKSWTKPVRIRTPLVYFPGISRLVPQPYGVVLIISSFNFPFQLALVPLVGAIAAGNCAVLKPSPEAAHSSKLLAKLIADNFDASFISVIEGGGETGRMLVEEKFDYIFFTGGTATGRLIMQAAAKNLTPLTLELGGKNPCIVDAQTNIEYTARRITWGKFFNAGQSCVSVDYLLVDKRIRNLLLDEIVLCINGFYGHDPAASPDFGRIVNEREFDRLSGLLKKGRIIAGGQTDRASRYIAPTIIDQVSAEDPLMQDEIFGPILPIFEYDDLADAISFVNDRPAPLALYFFSSDRRKQERMIRETASGGACINDTTLHETTQLPFGGTGQSGMGKYHGKASFDTFSNLRGIMKTPLWIDIRLRYPPYKNRLKWIKKFF